MKRIIYPFLLMLSLFVLASCSEWTETESIDIEDNTLKKTNPELYAQYTAALRAYKASEHKIVYTTFENVEQARNRSHHLTSLPDSIDFVELINPDIPGWVGEQMAEVREEKGTRFVLRISRGDILAQWYDLQEPPAGEEDDADPGNPEEDNEGELYAAFESACIAELFAKVERYGYDGVCVAYSGSYTEQMTEQQVVDYLAAQERFMAPVRAWVAANGSKLFFFEGYPQFVVDRDLLAAADYVILPTRRASRISELTFAALEIQRTEGLPECRLLYAVETLPYEEADVLTGRFGNGPQIRIAAGWVVEEDSFDKSGLVIHNVQRDYFDAKRRYSAVRSALKTMNPNA